MTNESTTNESIRKETIEQVLARIRQEAEASEAQPRFVRVCAVGDEIRQGDIYLYPIEGPPAHLDLTELISRQLADGNSAGSRHIAVGDAVAYDRPSLDPLDGPFLQGRSRFQLTHPEHADLSLPAGWYEVRYQRDFSAPQPRRVVD